MKRIVKVFSILLAVIVLCGSISGIGTIETKANPSRPSSTPKITYAGQIVDSITYRGITTNAVYTTPYSDSLATDGTYGCFVLPRKFYSNVYGITVSNLVSTTAVPKASSGYFTETRSPRVGDIVRFNTSTHWALVKSVSGSTVTLIQQNAWWNSYTCAQVGVTVDASDTSVSFFTYSGYLPEVSANPPTYNNISISKTNYSISDTIVIQSEANNNPTRYYLAVYGDDGRLVKVMDSDVSYKDFRATDIGSGYFTAYIMAENSAGHCDSAYISFSVYEDLGADFYATILNTKLWKPISLNPETHKVTLETEKSVAYQKWRFIRQNDGSYVIASCYDGYALEMTNGERVNETQLSATSADWGGAYQRWFLYRKGNGFIIQNRHFPNEKWVMDLYNNNSADGTKINIHSTNGSEAQIFSVYLGDDIQLAGVPLETEISQTDGVVTFIFNKNKARGAKSFNLKIWKGQLWEGDACVIAKDIDSGYAVELEDGTYYAYVDSCDYFHYEMSNVIELTIKKPQHQHSWNEFYTIDKEATCTQIGIKSIHCSTCGGKKEGSELTIPMKNHSYGNWVVTKEATVDEEGLKEKVCKICGDKNTEKIPKVVSTDGWIKDSDGTWYYYTNGIKTTGWKQVGGKWYLFNSSGAMLTGWQKDGGAWYYLNTSGVMVTGWLQDGGKWYYMNPSGAMVTGWQKVNGTWYFFKNSGAMAANEWCDGYWLNANGSWTYQPRGSWKKNNTGWWFGDTSGWYAKNTTQKIDNVNYTFNAAGYWVQ